MLVLASASPRRRELLIQAGFTFTVLPASIPEEQEPGESPIAFALRLARQKAETVFSRLTQLTQPAEPDASVPGAVLPPGPSVSGLLALGADTVVIAPDGSTLGKPRDAEDAARMLRLLAGATHQVVTGVCLCSAARTELAAELTYVTMHTLSRGEIEAYIATGESADKAGAYAIQGYAARWIPRIHGCYFNVVGLPLALVCSLIEAATTPRRQA